MRLLLLSLLLVSTQGSSHPNDPQGKTNNNPSNKCQPAIVEVHTSCPAEAATGQNHAATAQTEVKPFMTHGEYVISGITAIYVIVSLLTFFAIRRQAEFAERSTQSIILAERAWVLVSVDLSENHGIYGITLTNHGRTPARIVEAIGEYKQFNGAQDKLQDVPSYNTNILPAQKLLAPKEQWVIQVFGTSATLPLQRFQ